MRFQLFGLLALLSLPLAAQPARESVTIEVVDVPVFVTRDNQPVQGLSRDDFELYVNGKPQAIDYFDVMDSSTDTNSPSLRERRLFLLVFDVAFSPPLALGRAQRAAGELIARATPEDLFAVATYSPAKGIWLATPFTSDRVALTRGIANLNVSRSGDPLSIVMTASERASLGDWASWTPTSSDQYLRIQEVYQAQVRRYVEEQILDFRDLAGRLTALQGQKHIVLLSEGADGVHPERLSLTSSFSSDRIAEMYSGRLGIDYNMMYVTALRDGGMIFHLLREMAEAFQSAGILLHALDLKGLGEDPESEAMRLLATATGGKFVHSRNDLGDALTDLTDTFRSGYVLGFKPVAAKSKHNRIEVKVKNLARGTRVQYRKGFSGRPRPFNPNEGLYLADVVLNDVPQTGTAAELELVDRKVVVRVPLRPLAAQLGKRGKAEVLIYLFGADGVALGFHRQLIDVPADASGEKTFWFAMPEGATVAKAILRVDDSLGFSRTGA